MDCSSQPVRVSVIVPALNAAETIAEAVGSALVQTLRRVEVIVVDDGSSDATAGIVADIAARDERVRLLRHAEPRGVSAARNTAIRAACGEWIAVLDADDRFAPERLATLVAAAEQRHLDVIIDNLVLIDASTSDAIGFAFPPAWMVNSEPVALDFLMRHDFPGEHPFGIGYCKPMFRTTVIRDQVGGYREGLQCAEDVLALQMALYAGASLGTVSEAMYHYRWSSASLSSRPGAYPAISRVNQMISVLDRKHGGQMRQLLRARQIETDYDGFAKSAKYHRWSDLAYFVFSVPASRLLRGLRIAALKRLGLRKDASMDRIPIPELTNLG